MLRCDGCDFFSFFLVGSFLGGQFVYCLCFCVGRSSSLFKIPLFSVGGLLSFGCSLVTPSLPSGFLSFLRFVFSSYTFQAPGLVSWLYNIYNMSCGAIHTVRVNSVQI